MKIRISSATILLGALKIKNMYIIEKLHATSFHAEKFKPKID